MTEALQEMLRIKQPKAFRNFYDSNLTANQILNGLVEALSRLTNTATGQSAWTVDRRAVPIPGAPAARQAGAYTTYSYGGANWSVALSISVYPATENGSALLLTFTDALGWENGQSELLVDLTMRGVAGELANQWAQRGWRMIQGTWAFGHRFSPPSIDPSQADGDWRFPDGSTAPFVIPRPAVPDNMFEDCRYSRYYFRQFWGPARDLVHARLRAAVRQHFQIVDEDTGQVEGHIETTMVTAGQVPLHLRVQASERWGGVAASLSFALMAGWSDNPFDSAKDALLADLPRLAPDLFPDGRTVEGPALVPHSQGDIFRFWTTSLIFRQQIWGTDANRMLIPVATVLERHFVMDYVPGLLPGSHEGYGRSLRAEGLWANVTFVPSQGGVLLGLSLASPQHWADPAARAAAQEAFADLGATLHGLQGGLELEQGTCLWDLVVEAAGELCPEIIQAVKTAVQLRWSYLDRTPANEAGQALWLSGFLPGVETPVEMQLRVLRQDEIVYVSLALRQNELHLPSVAQQHGDATVEDIRLAIAAIAPAVRSGSMYHMTLDQLLALYWG